MANLAKSQPAHTITMKKADLFGVGASGATGGGIVAIGRNSGSITDYKLPTGVIAANQVIPAPVTAIIQQQFASVGLKFDVNKLALNKDNRAALQELRVTVDLIKNNAKILPALAKELKAAMSAATKQAEFNADLVKHSLKEQHNIDNVQADILLAMAGYTSKSQKLAAKLERKMEKIQRIQQAQTKHYNASHGKELEAIDANWDLLTSIETDRINTNNATKIAQADRKKANIAWLGGAGVKA